LADLTNSIVALCDYWQEKLQNNAEALGLVDVFYGDQSRIAKSPTLCIEPDLKNNPLRAAARVTWPEFTVYFIIYHAEIRNVEANRRDADVTAEKVEDFLNADPQSNGLLVHGYVSQSQSGYSPKANGLMRANRLTFTGTSRHQLPQSS
jgi:hypothetical protein